EAGKEHAGAQGHEARDRGGMLARVGARLSLGFVIRIAHGRAHVVGPVLDFVQALAQLRARTLRLFARAAPGGVQALFDALQQLLKALRHLLPAIAHFVRVPFHRVGSLVLVGDSRAPGAPRTYAGRLATPQPLGSKRRARATARPDSRATRTPWARAGRG